MEQTDATEYKLLDCVLRQPVKCHCVQLQFLYLLSEFICIALILVDETHKILITQEPSGQRQYNCWVGYILLLLLILLVAH